MRTTCLSLFASFLPFHMSLCTSGLLEQETFQQEGRVTVKERGKGEMMGWRPGGGRKKMKREGKQIRGEGSFAKTDQFHSWKKTEPAAVCNASDNTLSNSQILMQKPVSYTNQATNVFFWLILSGKRMVYLNGIACMPPSFTSSLFYVFYHVKSFLFFFMWN